MNYVRAGDSWLGLLIFLGAILFQLVSAFRKGKAARPPVPGGSLPRTPAPVARRPVPVPSPNPAPWRPEPVVVPVPPRTEAPAAQLPPRLRELFDELSGAAAEPPSVPVPPPAPARDEAAIAAAVRQLETAESAPAAAPSAWSRLRVGNRADWQRAFVLSEILQPPVALRPEGFSRTAHV